jgi:hypothetical protein
MQAEHQARTHSGTTRREVESAPATLSETRGLPTWESFPVEDRRRLVRTILQAARRQVETGLASSHARG